MILVDTSVWVDHFRATNHALAARLDAGAVLKVYLSRCLKMGLAMPQIIGAQAQTEAYWLNKMKA